MKKAFDVDVWLLKSCLNSNSYYIDKLVKENQQLKKKLNRCLVLWAMNAGLIVYFFVRSFL